MNRSLLPILAVPAAALAVMGSLVLAVRAAGGQHGRPPGARPVTAARVCPTVAGAARFVGVAVNSPLPRTVASFRQATGVQPSLVEFYDPFGAPFQRRQASQAVAAGAVPFIQLNPRKVAPARIAAGDYDGYLRGYAAAVKDFGCPVVLSFGHEMNGSWYPWGRPRTSPGEFIAAWRRIHDVFTGQHVRNVTWAWDPSHGGSSAAAWWPGESYADWIGLDGYLRPGQTFWQIFGRQLNVIRGLTRKPVFLAETAVAPGPEQPGQIAEMFGALRRYHLTGLVWFDVNRKEAWRLEWHAAASRAFRRQTRTVSP